VKKEQNVASTEAEPIFIGDLLSYMIMTEQIIEVNGNKDQMNAYRDI
jgi:hypothetical protein